MSLKRSSLRRVRSSRSNGARSRGPKTPEGKRRSSMNALRHGLLANCVVVEKESRANFDELVAQHVERLQPADGVEFGFVEEMASSYWRMRRAWALEKRIFENAIRRQEPGDQIDRMAAAFTNLAADPSLALMHRYETRLHCMYQRALHNLLLLRTAGIPNEPNPISGHLDSASDLVLPPAPADPVPISTSQSPISQPLDPGPDAAIAAHCPHPSLQMPSQPDFASLSSSPDPARQTPGSQDAEPPAPDNPSPGASRPASRNAGIYRPVE